jgi:hypothetical protein
MHDKRRYVKLSSIAVAQPLSLPPHRRAGELVAARVADGLALTTSGSPRVALEAVPRPGAIVLSGRVSAGSGAVTIYREHPGERRVAVASARPAADGSFAALDTPGAGRFLYRAVHSGAGLPAAALLRTRRGGCRAASRVFHRLHDRL